MLAVPLLATPGSLVPFRPCQRPFWAVKGSLRRPLGAQAAAAASDHAAPALPHLGAGVQWAVEVRRHVLTLPQVLQHLEQLQRIEAAAAQQAGSSSSSSSASSRCAQQHMISWVEHSTSATASLLDGVLAASDPADDDQLAALAALPQHLLTAAQRAAVAMQAWQSAAHTKPRADFDAEAQLTLPGLADVAVVSRGGWQRHSWKGCNQDAFLALPLAAGSAAACCSSEDVTACCSSAVAIGVFDGHGREGRAASTHLRNALASGLLMHSQLALMAQQPGSQPGSGSQDQGASGSCPSSADAAQAAAHAPSEGRGCAVSAHEEAAVLLERCFAAAAATMPSTGADFTLSGSTAVLCLVQPGSVTAAWAGDSRAVLGLCGSDGRYLACALTQDHSPGSPLERARIEASGGWVLQAQLDGEGRPCGPHRMYLRDTHIPGLAVSRCFGDYVATGAGVTSTPDITTLVLPLLGSPARLPSQPAPRNGSNPQQQTPGQLRGRVTEASAAGGDATGASATSSSESRRRPQRGSRTWQRPRRRSGRPRSQQAAHGASAGGPARSAEASSGGGTGTGGHHILVVASDGLWEFVGSSEAVRIASRCTCAQAAADALVLAAQAHWAARFGGMHCDDITVAVAFLPGSGGLGASAAAR